MLFERFEMRILSDNFQRVRVDDSDTPEAYVQAVPIGTYLWRHLIAILVAGIESIHVRLIATEADPSIAVLRLTFDVFYGSSHLVLNPRISGGFCKCARREPAYSARAR